MATHIHSRTRLKERSWSDLGSKLTSPATFSAIKANVRLRGLGLSHRHWDSGMVQSARSLARAGNRVLRQPDP